MEPEPSLLLFSSLPMNHETQQARRARQIIAERLRIFFAALQHQFIGGSDELLQKVEARWDRAQSSKAPHEQANRNETP